MAAETRTGVAILFTSTSAAARNNAATELRLRRLRNATKELGTLVTRRDKSTLSVGSCISRGFP